MQSFKNRFLVVFTVFFLAFSALGILSPDWSSLLLGILVLGIAMVGALTFYVLGAVEKSILDCDPMLNADPVRYTEVETGVEVPEKSWPNGHWYTEPRRKVGQL